MVDRVVVVMLLVVVAVAVVSESTVMVPMNLTLCNETSENVSRLMTDVYLVQPQEHDYCGQINISTPVLLRVVSHVPSTHTSRPVVFVSRAVNSVQTWKIPLKLQLFSEQFHTVERTLCSVPPSPLSQWGDDEDEVIIDVFTSSPDQEHYTIKVNPVEDAVMSLHQTLQLRPAVNAPVVRYFKFTNVSSVLVHATSPTTDASNGCIIVSVQNASCPVNDLHQNALSKGVYQTMLSTATLPVIANHTVEGDEFFVVVLVTHGSVCDPHITMNNSKLSEQYPYSHTVNITITELAEAPSNPLALVLPVVVFLCIGVVTIITFILPDKCCPSLLTRGYSPLAWFCDKFSKGNTKINTPTRPPSVASSRHSCINDDSQQGLVDSMDEFPCHDENKLPFSLRGDIEDSPLLGSKHSYGSIGTRQDQPDDSMGTGVNGVDKQYEVNNENGENMPGVRSKGYMKITGLDDDRDFLKSETGAVRALLDEPESEFFVNKLTTRKSLVSEYRVYGWNALTVGIFYGLPAFQLVLGQQLSLDVSGNMDQCYYNFECAHPWGALSAFNSVWSNMGYFILGFTFLIIVLIRHYKAEHTKRSTTDQRSSHGIPQFYGIYYAMGFALVLEGFMSAFYHICPSEYNFQFDTAFMFIIGGLLTVKLLQSRHPDINANAFIAFFCFAVVIFLTMIGIYESQKAPLPTRVTIVVIILVSMMLFFLSFYYLHDWRVGNFFDRSKYVKFVNYVKNSLSKEKWKPRHKIRFFKLLIVASFNIFLGISLAAIGRNIPTIVLGLFVATFMALLCAYILLKVAYKEPWTPAAVFHLLVLGVCWLSAFWFYGHSVTNWALSPSESRALNKPCLVLSFYDNHDVWHFLSACAMFFSFLFLFTLDDGLKDTPTNRIHIF